MKTNNARTYRRLLCAGLALALAAISAAADLQTPKDYPELKQGTDGYWQVDFGQLASFPFSPPPTDVPPNRAVAKMHPFFTPEAPPVIDPPPAAGSLEGIPPMVQALEGQRVRLTGFMLPTRLENGLVREFLLIRSQMTCCYGVAPAPNEWVVVAMMGKGVPQKMDLPLNLYGVLHVGAMFEDHEFSGLYRLDCEKVVAR
jgi:hypothetical protein